MKKQLLLSSFSLVALLFCGCDKIEPANNKPANNRNNNEPINDIYLDKPNNTNLEYWITQKVNGEDLVNSGCTYLPGWFGAEEYLDSRYDAEISEGIAVAPLVHVTYLLTGYPDTLDETAVTHIEITDPDVNVYGLTFNSTYEDITTSMNGIADSFPTESVFDECYCSFVIKNCTFSFLEGKIIIDVPVTNEQGIVY